MIDFSALKGLTIPEGVVTKIESGGMVLWALQNNEPIVLKVKKITSNTYASETDYTDDHFILLDIYPKKNGTVKVTYGGITKTIKDDGTSETPNAQQVLFGTFNGVPDETETPESGTLTIEGDCAAFGAGSYMISSKANTPSYCSCITEISGLTGLTFIPDYAFYECQNISISEIPEGVKTIGAYAFSMPVNFSGDGVITAITSLTFPASLESIGDYAFSWLSSKGDYKMLCPMTFLGTTPPTLGTMALGIGNRVTVPVGCAEAYKAAEGWSDLAYNIVEASE